MRASWKSSSRAAGFSLVEVTIAMGIIVFGLVSILGSYASLHSLSGYSDMRDDAAFAINSIRNYLQGENRFNEVYDDIKGGTTELVFFTYRGVEPDQPDVLARNLYGHSTKLDSSWIDREIFPGVTNGDLEKARDGQMFRAVLDLDESVNPVLRSELETTEVEDYNHGYIALKLSLLDIYDTEESAALLEGRRPVFSTTLVITR
jgi:type II secretory pathway pseudopilin PulG